MVLEHSMKPQRVYGRMEGSKQPLQIPGEEAENNKRIDSGGLSQSTHSKQSSLTGVQLSAKAHIRNLIKKKKKKTRPP